MSRPSSPRADRSVQRDSTGSRGAPPESEPTLQLALGREGLGLELSAPLRLGPTIAGPRGTVRAPITVVEARAKIVGASFPLDVSGGVDRFRHRRSDLQRAQIALDLPAIERWIARLAIDLIAPGTPNVRVEALAHHDVATDARDVSGARITLTAPPSTDPRALDGALAPLLAMSIVFGVDAGTVPDATAAMRIVVHEAHGLSLRASAFVLAGALLARAATALDGEAHGLALAIDDVARAISVHAFVPRGARLPSTRAVRVTSLRADGRLVISRDKKSAFGEVAAADRVTLSLSANAVALARSAAFAHASEVHALTEAGDAAFVAGARGLASDPNGDDDGAREAHEPARGAYLDALAKAPKHPAILLRLAEVDAQFGDEGARTEAALGWLREAAVGDALERTGHAETALARALLAATLHARSASTRPASRHLARSLFSSAAEAALAVGESMLAARCWAVAASLSGVGLAAGRARELEEDGESSAHEEHEEHEEREERDEGDADAAWLDLALGADPGLAAARWLRARARIARGDDALALEDLQHLEALARGRDARRRTLLAAATLLLAAGRPKGAVTVYERALRYTPDDRETVAGLAAALAAAGEPARSMGLLAHALTRPGESPSDGDLRIDLAKLIAAQTGDLSAAIARVRGIADDVPRAVLARALEGRWCSSVGDAPGAADAWSRAADLAPRRATSGVDADEAATLLADAAALAERAADRVAALRFARGALALAPTRRALQRLAERLSRPASPDAPDASDTPRGDSNPDPSPASAATTATTLRGLLFDDDANPHDSLHSPGAPDDARLDAEAEQLLARVKANADDEGAVDRLVDVLSALGRDFELFALLSARFDDADPETQRRLVPRQQSVLSRLADAADRRGRGAEASVYREAGLRLA